ncbi:helix-turn-helix domain-containing protein [Nocardia sp. NPDC127579]|uniref:helix-turn-helix domain-containing protein n=1 Tax=Nocardia sp. NPDC127579 TaxID=3345402 RepID=UPI0036319DCF
MAHVTKPQPRRRSRTETGPLVGFGAFLAERRLRLGLTQVELADLADVGLSSVRTLEAGQASTTMAVALRVLDALGLSLLAVPQIDARTTGGDAVEVRGFGSER